MRFYISNIMTEPGQTDNYSLSEHIKAIQEHVGEGLFDYCLADTGEIVPEYIRKYNKEGSEVVELDTKNLSSYNIKLIQKDMSCIKDEKIRHNTDLIASMIMEMICNDLKFHDMQNNTQYLLLQSVLKEQKKIRQKEEKKRKKLEKSGKEVKPAKEIKGKSKFKEKYKDRVASIQNTDKKIEQNKQIAKEIENYRNSSDYKIDETGREPVRRRKNK